MKKLVVLVLAAAVLCTGCAAKMEKRLGELTTKAPVNEADAIPDICSSPDGKYQIALCLSGTMLKDRGFNEYCLNGVKLFANENNKTYKYYIPAKDATDQDNADCVRAAITNGAEVVVVVGFNYGNPLNEVAPQNPDVKFVFVDGWDTGYNNVASVAFRENEGGYLAGYSAVKEGYTRLGFIGGGGGSNGACNRYGRGFVCGAEDAAKELGKKVEVNYSYQYATTFTGSPELQAMTNAWYTNGTEVIFSAAGSAQDSVAAAAAANDAWIIACDADASARSRAVLTTSVKRTDVATKLMLEVCFSDKWDSVRGKSMTLGVSDGAICLPVESWRFKNFTIGQYEELMDRMKAGEIKVDDDHNNNASSEWLTFRKM